MDKQEVVKRLSVAKVAVEIANRNQEKDFICLCRKVDAPYARKDKTAYKGPKGKIPIYPIYYGFIWHNNKVVGWYDKDKKYLDEQGYLFMSFKDFRRQFS